MAEALLETNLPDLKLHARGKVRDIYPVGDDLLMVATDRISAFDHVLATGIPGKGKVLNQLSVFWFNFLADMVPSHFITAKVDRYPEPLKKYHDQLRYRSMLVKRVEMIPFECVVRGYLTGSAWREYQQTGSVCGIALLPGLVEADRLPEPFFTPATKAATGNHDVNVSMHDMGQRIGVEKAELLRDLSLMIYNRASERVAAEGLILADTKFEFGMTPQGVVLSDEVLTPDSSRYWWLTEYRPGGPQVSLDKQFVRDYLIESGWNRQAPAPGLPPEIVARTQEIYTEAYRRITGYKSFEEAPNF